MINIAILGFGVVGSGVADVLTKNSDIIEAKLQNKVNIKYILDLRDFPDSQFSNLIVHDFNIILNDPEVDIVAEMMGGSHPAYDFSKAALIAGKSVVTSNKEVVASFGAELLDIAKTNGVSYLFEASVGGGIPIIRPMCRDLTSNNINEINGILNGTTNYILTKMMQEGVDFNDALREAQLKGYAEKDPSADVLGLDAARKIVILAALAYGASISPDDIRTEGITDISEQDVKISERLGYTIKLIGHAKKTDDGILAIVSPRIIPTSHPLATINDVFNGILLSCDIVGDVMFYGPGAGKFPTASAVCADIVDIIANGASGVSLPSFKIAQPCDTADFALSACRRMFIFERPLISEPLPDFAKGIFGPIDELLIWDSKVALITAEKITEHDAADIQNKLTCCKMYRVL